MKKILVCDDAEEILEVIEIMLSESGYEVKTISDSTNILEIIKEFKPKLVLLDLWMKNSDGRDVAKEIHSHKEFKELPIFFISALNELDQIAEEAGVQGFIRKPFDMDDLLSKVGKILEENSEEDKEK